MSNDTNRDQKRTTDSNPANRDPITGTPGAHPVGTGVGAAAGGAAGAAIGAIGGPVGAAVGAVVGAVAGGLGGKAAAEAADPTVEDSYWEKNYKTRPYAANSQVEYKDYRPAYRYGWESASRAQGKSFDDMAPALERDWNKVRSGSSLEWDRAKDAARDAWDRVSTRRN